MGPGVGESRVGLNVIEGVVVWIGVGDGNREDVEVKIADCVMRGMEANGVTLLAATVIVPVMIFISSELEEIRSLVDKGL